MTSAEVRSSRLRAGAATRTGPRARPSPDASTTDPPHPGSRGQSSTTPPAAPLSHPPPLRPAGGSDQGTTEGDDPGAGGRMPKIERLQRRRETPQRRLSDVISRASPRGSGSAARPSRWSICRRTGVATSRVEAGAEEVGRCRRSGRRLGQAIEVNQGRGGFPRRWTCRQPGFSGRSRESSVRPR